MNATQLLKNDHDEVRGLFEEFRTAQEADDTQRMTEVAGTVFEELEVHTTIEEEIFYPAIRDADEELGELVNESVQEHHVVDVLMNEMRDLPDGSDDWVAKMTVLIENVEHHAEEEEQEMFPTVEDALGPEQLQELGGQLEQRKATAKADLATKEELYEKAQELDIPGRSEMTKDELAKAVAEAA
jgi:hemerythrin superfamily protein